MSKFKPAINYNCNHCAAGVTEVSHLRHLKIYDIVMSAGLVGCDDLFVHERGHIQSFDPDGVVVVCDSCFIRELSDNLSSISNF